MLGREITFGSGFGLLPRWWKFCTWSLVTWMATATPPHLQRLPGVSGTPSWPRVWVFATRSLPRAALGRIRQPAPSAVPFCTSGRGLPCQVPLQGGDLAARSVHGSCQKRGTRRVQLQRMCFSLWGLIPCRPKLLIRSVLFPVAAACLTGLCESCLCEGKVCSRSKAKHQWVEHKT